MWKPSPLFTEQLTAFEVWLDHWSEHKKPPEQLPIVPQVLLNQCHRFRAPVLLGRFTDMGPLVVDLALSVGIFPYVLKLLQTTTPRDANRGGYWRILIQKSLPTGHLHATTLADYLVHKDASNELPNSPCAKKMMTHWCKKNPLTLLVIGWSLNGKLDSGTLSLPTLEFNWVIEGDFGS
ncbi:unnamed protein product [Lactuca saligna]|uniref:Uncharacterized protein n=1 Tax=Lactuca saligna TaxID=75948 RepID=A0AA36EBS2_LACSI|nr:unnamed protein product [Lactuca saligna]